MATDLSQVNIVTRREIEARIVAPLLKAFMKEFGKEKVLKIAQEVINSIAAERGREFAKLFGGNSLDHWATKAVEYYTKTGHNEIEVLEHTKNKLSLKITKCVGAEMYKEIGLPEFGYLLSCSRDFSMYKAFNPKFKLTRTKTIMEGFDHCDFLVTLEE